MHPIATEFLMWIFISVYCLRSMPIQYLLIGRQLERFKFWCLLPGHCPGLLKYLFQYKHPKEKALFLRSLSDQFKTVV